MTTVTAKVNLWDEQTGYPTPGINTTRFTLSFTKLPNLQLFCNKINMPSITLGVANQPTTILDMKQVGEKLVYSQFSCEFILDNQMAGYREIHQWMKDLSVQGLNSDTVSEATLITEAADFQFVQVFPISIGEIQFDSTQTDLVFPSCHVTFECDYYYIK